MNVDDLVKCYETDCDEEAHALEDHGDIPYEEINKFYEGDSWKETMENLENELNNCTAGLDDVIVKKVKETSSLLKPTNTGLQRITRKKHKLSRT